MSSNNHKNKARNQTRGGGQIDAPWFRNRVSRSRRRTKLARKTKQKQWRRKK